MRRRFVRPSSPAHADMIVRRFTARHRQLLLCTSLLLATWLIAAPAALAGPRGSATITATFADSCRDFVAHSSKDISHVETHYADGQVVKDESIVEPDYTIDGGPGAEITFAIVKSGRTVEGFECAGGSTPVALLETRRCAAVGCAD